MDRTPRPMGVDQSSEFQNLLTTSEVANILRCSERTIYRRVIAGALPAIRDGGRLLFDAKIIRAGLLVRMSRSKSKSPITFPADALRGNRPIPDDQKPDT